MGKLNKEEAKRILSNTSPERAFWINNGQVLKSIMELPAAAKKMTVEQFTHHVNAAKNDFAKWIDEVIGDKELAKKLRLAKTKDGLVKAVTGRLKQLQGALK